MENALLDRQEALWAAVFYGAIIVLALGEVVLPRRRASRRTPVRWSSNIVLAALNVTLAGLILPAGLVGLAILARDQGWGLLNAVALPGWLAVAAGFLAFDAIKYAEHRLMHEVPVLWRLHAVHHADTEVDFTSGYRHHPFEAVLDTAVFALAVCALGVPPVAVLLFHLVASFMALYTHANIRWHPALDRALRWVLMTRDAHAVHHSALRPETDSNYGQVLLWWDRLFGSYRARPAAGLDRFTVGLEYFRAPRDQWLDRILAMPFRIPAGAPVGADQPGERQSASP